MRHVRTATLLLVLVSILALWPPLGEAAPRGSIVAAAAPAPTFRQYEDPDGLSRAEGVQGLFTIISASAGEPSLGVDQVTGDVLLQVDRLTLMLRPDGASGQWADVSYPAAVSLPVSDPIGFLDVQTGRYFSSTILGDCSQMGFTDDDGATWTPTSGACDAFGGHDHQTVGGGPFPPGLSPLTSYPNAVWYCAQFSVGGKCSISLDGGLTFLPAEPAYSTVVGLNGNTFCSAGATNAAQHGHIRVAPNGTAVLPVKSCGSAGNRGGAITFDGLNWRTFAIPGTSSRSHTDFDPSAAFGKDGTLYYGMCDGDDHPKVAVSTTGARTWSAPVDVGAPLGLKNCEFAEVIAGDGDRAAFAFLGSTTPGNDQDASFAGVWHMYVAMTTDRGATWTTTDLTPNDPVQKGCIWAAGGINACRNLLDFNDIALDGEGNVYIAFADGCVATCVNGTGPSTSAVGAVLAQTGGDCLFAGKCGHHLQTGPLPTPRLALPSAVPNADACSPNIIVFSRAPSQPAAFDSHSTACNVERLAGVAPANTALITPGAVDIQIRYGVDVPGAANLTVTLDGLGLTGATGAMAKTTSTTGGVTYDSARFPISGSGDITIRVSKPDNTLLGTAVFHTAT